MTVMIMKNSKDSVIERSLFVSLPIGFGIRLVTISASFVAECLH